MEGIQYGMQQGYNPMTTAGYPTQPYGSVFGQQNPFAQQNPLGQQSQFGQPGQFGQQGLFGSQINPLSGVIGSGIAGLQAGQYFGRQPGQLIDGFGGMFHAYGAMDPVTASQVQQAQQQQALQAQLAQQQIAQRLQFAQLAQSNLTPWLAANPQIANPFTRLDPVTAAYVQQAQIAQLCQQLGLQGPIGQFGHPIGFGQQTPPWLGAGQQGWLNPLLAAVLSRGMPYQQGQLPVY